MLKVHPSFSAAHHDISGTEFGYNRRLFVADNYNLLRGLKSESVDLVTTDPPFAKNGTFVGGLKPALTAKEIAVERSMLAHWGIEGPEDAAEAGIEWPTGDTTAKFRDIWSWEKDVHEEWIDNLEDTHPHIARLIDNIRYTHSDGVAAYIAFMTVRLIECHRVLKPTGSLFLHCDQSANGYLRMLLDAIFGHEQFRNEIVWCYSTGGASPTRFAAKHDTILFYSKSDRWIFNTLRVPYLSLGAKPRHGFHPEGKIMPDWWTDMNALNTNTGERTGYPTQKPWALAERIIKSATNEGDVVLDPFAGCAYTAVAAESLGRRWMACDISPRALTVMRRQFAKRGWAIDGVAPEGMLEGLEVCNVTVSGPGDVPERDHNDPLSSVMSLPDLPERNYKKTSKSDMPHREMRKILLRLSGWQCWACGYATRNVDGEIVKSSDHFHLDHVEPKSYGGSNKLWNRALLCATCNKEKRDRQVTLAAFREEPSVKSRRESYGIHGYPVDLQQVRDAANEAWSAWRTQHGLDAPRLPGIW